MGEVLGVETLLHIETCVDVLEKHTGTTDVEMADGPKLA